MKSLCKIKLVAYVILMLLPGLALSDDNLYVFVFKDGFAQKNITIAVGDALTKTNEFGRANFSLPEDEYEVGYYKDDELFALTEVNLLQGQQSQIFLNLTRKGAYVDLDLPLSAYTQDFKEAEVKQQTGPKGTLKLKLSDSRSKEPVAGAKLFFKGYAVEAVSGEDGTATVELSEGSYDISVIHPSFVMSVMKNIAISKEVVTEQSLGLVKADIVMAEYVVTAPAVEGSLATTFTSLKESDVIGDAISSEEFTKSGDSSAADALKRVTGITIVDGKYVYVRGLGERYSVVMLNNLYVPSPEPTKRVVPLDIFPSSVIQSMDIQKTYSPDLPGTFAGGDVLIESKDIPEEDNYVKLSLSTSYYDATGDKVYVNSDNSKGMPADIIEKSSNFQELQQGYPSIGVPGYTVDELKAMNSAISNYRTYNLHTTELKPGQKLALDFGQSFKTSGGLKYGFVGTLYNSTDADSKTGIKYNTHYEIPTAELTNGERSDFQVNKLAEKKGGVLSFGIDNQSGHKIKYTYLSLDDKREETTFSVKDGGPEGPGIDDEEKSYLEHVEKTITANQLSGGHHFDFPSIEYDLFNNVQVSWAYENSKATRYEPGTVDYVYEKTSDVTDYTLNKKIWFLYSNLNDKVDNYRLDVKFPFELNQQENYSSFGIFNYQKSRTLDNRRFKVEHSLGTDVFEDIDSVFTQQNVDSGDLVLTSNYREADAYTAKQDVSAFYFKQLYSISKNLELLAGFRQETSSQQLIDSETGLPYDPLETDDMLLSMGLNYSFNDENKLRFSFANTLTRPDFREFSPNRYKDPITDNIVFGYPDLTYTTITNIDLKYEWYFSYDEMFSFGIFQKDFTNPVETIENIDPYSQSGTKIITFRNAQGATSSGIELSLRKKLDFIGNSFSNYFIAINYAIIDSNIQLDKSSSDEVIQQLTSSSRPMQGQSPYVKNINIGYDNINTGRSAIFLYNEFGKRIDRLGSYGAPDYYEYPFKKLDFVLKWRLNDTYDEQVKKIGYSLGLKIQNILDSEFVIKQGGVVSDSYKPGTSFNLSFSMSY